MDKFTKTTEVDISNMNTVEDEAPQKGKIGKIIAIVISLLLAVSIWIYAMETDETKVEKEYTDIKVVVQNAPKQFNVTASDVSVTLVGTNSQLVDVDRSEITVIVDASSISEAGVYEMFTSVITVTEENGVAVKDNFVKVKLSAKEKK